jgi:hypothetical protein
LSIGSLNTEKEEMTFLWFNNNLGVAMKAHGTTLKVGPEEIPQAI